VSGVGVDRDSAPLSIGDLIGAPALIDLRGLRRESPGGADAHKKKGQNPSDGHLDWK